MKLSLFFGVARSYLSLVFFLVRMRNIQCSIRCSARSAAPHCIRSLFHTIHLEYLFIVVIVSPRLLVVAIQKEAELSIAMSQLLPGADLTFDS